MLQIICPDGNKFAVMQLAEMMKSNLIISPCGIANLVLKRFSVFLPFLVHLCKSRRVRVFHMFRNNRTAIVFSKIGVRHLRFGEISQVGVFSLDLLGIVFHKFRDTDSVIRLFIFVNVVFAYFKGIEIVINDCIHKIIGAFAILH